MGKGNQDRIKIRDYARGTGFYICSRFRSITFLLIWLLATLLFSVLVVFGIGNWGFKILLFVGLIPALVVFYLLGRIHKRLEHKIQADVLKKIQGTEEVLSTIADIATGSSDGMIHEDLGPLKKPLLTLTVIIFLVGFGSSGLFIEGLLRFNSGFRIFNFAMYSKSLVSYLFCIALLALQTLVYIWTPKLQRWRMRLSWGEFYHLLHSNAQDES